jgi:adenylate kinase
MRLILLGKPGSGKGTQSKHISSSRQIPAISTGDLIRQSIAKGTDLGKRFKSYTDKGLLVPDDLMIEMVDERLSRKDARNGFLLDGFPRTVPQAEALETLLEEKKTPLDAVVNLVVPDEILVARATGRRVCPKDASTYHVKFSPPRRPGLCDLCGTALTQRADDTEAVVVQRIEQYREKTAPLIDFYKGRGLLIDVDGEATPEHVEKRIERALSTVDPDDE